jgi:hypothetical protein
VQRLQEKFRLVSVMVLARLRMNNQQCWDTATRYYLGIQDHRADPAIGIREKKIWGFETDECESACVVVSVVLTLSNLAKGSTDVQKPWRCLCLATRLHMTNK